MASLLAVTPYAAEAKKPKPAVTKKAAVAAKGLNLNTTHCTYTPLPADKKWTWESADIKARFVPLEDEKYGVEVIGKPRHADVKLPIASITKNMTAYLVFEAVKKGHLKFDQKIPIAPVHFCLSDNDFATRYLPVGIRDITVGDAVTLLLRQSNNTMAMALADAVAGNEVQFVEKMNSTVASWGMKNTRFMNPNGLPVGDRTGEYITADDALILAQHMLDYERDYRLYTLSPLKVNGVDIKEGAHLEKGFLRGIGAIFKTATINGCRSLMTIVDMGDDKFVSVQLCAKDDRFAVIKRTMKDYWQQAGVALDKIGIPKAEAHPVLAQPQRPAPPSHP